VDPCAQLRRRFGLTGFLQQVVLLNPWFELCSFLACVLSERGKAIPEGLGLFDAASL
jgi:hypothetical protein